MTTQAILAAMIGGWEVGVIFGLLLVLILVISAVVGIFQLIRRATTKKAGTLPPPLPDQASLPVSRADRETRDYDSPIHRLYSPNQIALAAFLGSPLAGCWFWSRNYQRLGRSNRSTQCLIWGAVGTAALVAILYFLPGRFTELGFTAACAAAMLQAAKRTHGSIVNQHLSAGGRLGSWWAVVGMSLLFGAFVFAVNFGVILLLHAEQ